MAIRIAEGHEFVGHFLSFSREALKKDFQLGILDGLGSFGESLDAIG